MFEENEKVYVSHLALKYVGTFLDYDKDDTTKVWIRLESIEEPIKVNLIDIERCQENGNDTSPLSVELSEENKVLKNRILNIMDTTSKQ